VLKVLLNTKQTNKQISDLTLLFVHAKKTMLVADGGGGDLTGALHVITRTTFVVSCCN